MLGGEVYDVAWECGVNWQQGRAGGARKPEKREYVGSRSICVTEGRCGWNRWRGSETKGMGHAVTLLAPGRSGAIHLGDKGKLLTSEQAVGMIDLSLRDGNDSRVKHSD